MSLNKYDDHYKKPDWNLNLEELRRSLDKKRRLPKIIVIFLITLIVVASVVYLPAGIGHLMSKEMLNKRGIWPSDSGHSVYIQGESFTINDGLANEQVRAEVEELLLLRKNAL